MKEENEFFKKLIKAQGEFETIEPNQTNPFYKSRYADLTAIIKIVKPILSKNGLFYYFKSSTIKDNLFIKCIVSDGIQSISTSLSIKNIADVQKLGSSITYLKRYTLSSILGIAIGEVDDDGNENKKLTKEEEQKKLREFEQKKAEKDALNKALMNLKKLPNDIKDYLKQSFEKNYIEADNFIQEFVKNNQEGFIEDIRKYIEENKK